MLNGHQSVYVRLGEKRCEDNALPFRSQIIVIFFVFFFVNIMVINFTQRLIDILISFSLWLLDFGVINLHAAVRKRKGSLQWDTHRIKKL